MLVQGAMILMREEGHRLAVEDLKIGGFVFDPFADKYCEIIDILARSVVLEPPPEGQNKHPLCPVQLRPDILGLGRPTEPVWLSPSQGILTASKEKPGRTPVTELVTASRYASGHTSREQCSMAECKYFAIFTEKPQYLDVSGLLITTFTDEVYNPAHKAT